MVDIVALLKDLSPYLTNTTVRQLEHIVLAMLCIPNRITMLNLSRWTERGGSYRTLQRWYHTPLSWATILWSIVRIHLLDPDGVYLLAADDVVVSKSGKKTHGLGLPSIGQGWHIVTLLAQTHGAIEKHLEMIGPGTAVIIN